MARIRTIKPEFFTSADIASLSPIARLLYIALWCEADREGRMTWKPKTFKLRYFPADNFDIEQICSELVNAGLVVTYGGSFACIPTFKQHQNINPRESESKLPQFSLDTPKIDASLTRDDASNLDLHAQWGKEGKGREGKGKETTPHPYPSPQPEPVGEVKSEEPKSDYLLDNPDSPVFDITRGWLALIEKTFGKQSARLAPAADDKIFAKRWLDDGLLITEIMLYLEGSLAKIKEKGGQPPSGLKYFDKFIRENLKRSPQAQENTRNNPIKTDTFWKMRMTGFIKNNIWPDGAGAPPGRDGCDVPPEILREYGFQQSG